MSAVISPLQVAQSLAELWSPRVISDLDDCYVKVAKVNGTFGWHTHADEDELFFVLSGQLQIDMALQTVLLNAGDCYVVPKGVAHNPSANADCCILLIEKKTTAHSGEAILPHTKSIADQLRPI